jgi:hypothetical protein
MRANNKFLEAMRRNKDTAIALGIAFLIVIAARVYLHFEKPAVDEFGFNTNAAPFSSAFDVNTK